jgi:hypothetical protein
MGYRVKPNEQAYRELGRQVLVFVFETEGPG